MDMNNNTNFFTAMIEECERNGELLNETQYIASYSLFELKVYRMYTFNSNYTDCEITDYLIIYQDHVPKQIVNMTNNNFML